MPGKWEKTYGEQKAKKLVETMNLFKNKSFADSLEEDFFQKEYMIKGKESGLSSGYDDFEQIDKIKNLYDNRYFVGQKYRAFPAYGTPAQLFIDAAYFGRRYSIRLLIQAGADINAADNDGNTALHAISFRDDGPEAMRILKLLLENGADPFQINEMLISPYEILLHDQARTGFPRKGAYQNRYPRPANKTNMRLIFARVYEKQFFEKKSKESGVSPISPDKLNINALAGKKVKLIYSIPKPNDQLSGKKRGESIVDKKIKIGKDAKSPKENEYYLEYKGDKLELFRISGSGSKRAFAELVLIEEKAGKKLIWGKHSSIHGPFFIEI